jgi:uncharacterized protein YgbK (DUF1537 family)
MPTGANLQLGVIADDVTGALDSGVEFVRAGWSAALALDQELPQADLAALSTESRDGDVASARRRAALAATRLAGRVLFKKIDSTMRGHVGAELEAVMRAAGAARAVVCPAAIEAGRTVLDGQLLVHGVPLDQSEFARDPRWPAGTADLKTLIGLPVWHLPLETVRSHPALLRQAIVSAPAAIVSADACQQSDLAAISRAIVDSGSMPCGALGLARAWAQALGGRAPGQLRPPELLHTGLALPALIVAGSHHPRSAAQVRALTATGAAVAVSPDQTSAAPAADLAIAALGAGQTVVLHTPSSDLQGRRAQQRAMQVLADTARQICGALRPGLLVLTGGETARLVGATLGVRAIAICGEVEVGMPRGRMVGGLADGLLVVTKAGGFGGEQVLLRFLKT